MIGAVPLTELRQSRTQRTIRRRLMRLFHESPTPFRWVEVDTPKKSGNPGTLCAFELALCLGYARPAAVTHDHGLELFQLDEIVSLAAQLVGHHGRLRADRRADGNPPSPS